MSLSEQIIRSFTSPDVRAVVIKPSFGTVRISRKEYFDMFGTRQTNFKAELIEAGREASCKANNPLMALAGLDAQLKNWRMK